MHESRSAKIVDFSICILLSVLYFADLPHDEWLFHFSHANVFHLVSNIIFISAIFKETDHRLLPLAYIVTSLMWFIAGSNIIGFSSIIYFMWGTRIIHDFQVINTFGDKAKKQGLIYAIGIGGTFVISAIVPSITFYLHFFPFMAGVITSATIMLIQMFKKDMA